VTDAEMRVWAEAHVTVGSSLAAGVLRLLEEVAACRKAVHKLADRLVMYDGAFAVAARALPFPDPDTEPDL
jgi:hypothetical protein